VSNSAFKGQVYIVNVWGTWCEACRQEHEALLAIARQKVVPMIGLVYMDQRDNAKAWLDQLGNPYTAVAIDTDGRTVIDWGSTERRDIPGGRAGAGDLQFISPMTPEVWQQEFLPRIAAARRAGA